MVQLLLCTGCLGEKRCSKNDIVSMDGLYLIYIDLTRCKLTDIRAAHILRKAVPVCADGIRRKETAPYDGGERGGISVSGRNVPTAGRESCHTLRLCQSRGAVQLSAG